MVEVVVGGVVDVVVGAGSDLDEDEEVVVAKSSPSGIGALGFRGT